MMLLDMIQCDRVIEARKPDVVLNEKMMKDVNIIDKAVPGDRRVKDKEIEKLEKYQMLKEELRRLWKMKTVTVLHIVIGESGAVSQRFTGYMNKVGANIGLEIIQNNCTFGGCKIAKKSPFSLETHTEDHRGTFGDLLTPARME